MTTLRRDSRLNPDNYSAAIASLVENGAVEPCDIEKGKRKFEGYRPVSSDQPTKSGFGWLILVGSTANHFPLSMKGRSEC